MAHPVKKSVSRLETIPFVANKDLFQNDQDSRFAIGIFDSDEVINYESNSNELVKGYLQLRANTYIDYSNILSDDARRHDGTEIDQYDSRSVHFAIFERVPASDNSPEGVDVVGSSRLVIKNKDNEVLPLENTFNDLHDKITVGGVEVSRFIVNHGEKSHQQKLMSKLIMAQLAYVMANNFCSVHGVVERRFQRRLEIFGVASKTESGPIYVREGGGANGEGVHTTELLAIRILTDSIERKFGKVAIDKMSMDLGDFNYWGQLPENQKIVKFD